MSKEDKINKQSYNYTKEAQKRKLKKSKKSNFDGSGIAWEKKV